MAALDLTGVSMTTDGEVVSMATNGEVVNEGNILNLSIGGMYCILKLFCLLYSDNLILSIDLDNADQQGNVQTDNVQQDNVATLPLG